MFNDSYHFPLQTCYIILSVDYDFHLQNSLHVSPKMLNVDVFTVYRNP